MNWEALGAIGEIVGAIAVIVTLAYLARQIRQNTREMRLSAFQNITDRIHRWNENLARDPELARIYAAGLLDPESLNENERIRFETHAGNSFRGWEDIFLHHRDALVDEEVWEAKHAQLKIFLSEPGMRWIWKRRKATFTRSFRSFIDRELDTLSSSGQSSGCATEK